MEVIDFAISIVCFNVNLSQVMPAIIVDCLIIHTMFTTGKTAARYNIFVVESAVSILQLSLSNCQSIGKGNQP